MLTNPETGAERCDHCGAELSPETKGLDEAGSAICPRCVGRLRGYRQAEKDLHREQLRFALFQAINDLELSWVTHELNGLLEEAARAQRPLKAVE